jgi:hypothetical protein
MVFHTQMASIMEVLANAAVAEICKLVDDDYAVFRLEITQSQKENRGLRRKLQLLEIKVARERAERTMRERVLASRPSSVKILDRHKGMARGTFLQCVVNIIILHTALLYCSVHTALPMDLGSMKGGISLLSDNHRLQF